MKILVTGANGYIGSRVLKKLCDLNFEVIATDMSDTHIDKRATFIQANIFEDKNWYEYFGKPDICLHMAWRDGFIHNSIKHINDLPSHFKFITNLIDNGLKKIVTMGSMHEVGYWEGAIDENTPCKPMSLYGIAKNALREALELYVKDKNCDLLWLRAFYIYGDDSFGNSIFCKIRKAVEEGKDKFPFTSGKNEYDFIHIDDLASQICKCVIQNKVTGIINCCSGKPESLSSKIEWYISKNSFPIKLDYGKYPDRPYDSPCIYGDTRKIDLILRDFDKYSKKILITGAKGQLGYDCIKELEQRGYINVRGVDINDLDISKKNDVYKYVNEYKPDVIIHCAAWTAVDKAELNKNLVYEINALGTKYLSEAAAKNNSKIVYISTDYVFDGKGNIPFETNSPKGGLSTYGRSKSDGEDFVINTNPKHFIIRTTGVFGKNGNNFIKTMLKLAELGKKEVNVVNDQIVSVTYTKDLSVLIADMIETDKYGIYHAANLGYFSWSEFAKEIFDEVKKDVIVHPISTKEYMELVPGQTERPKNSRLSFNSLTNAGFNLLPDHKDALRRYLKEIL